MKKYIFHELDESDRFQMIQDHADKKVDNFKFTKVLTPEEVEDYRAEFAGLHLDLSEIQKQLKLHTDRVKAEIKPIVAQIGSHLKVMQTNSIEVEDTAYLIPDYEENMMGYYDASGELIFSRRLKPDERQTNIHHQIRKIS